MSDAADDVQREESETQAEATSPRDEDGEAAETPEIAGRVRESLKGVIDPELGLNIVDLGLVYDVEVEDRKALVTMTLTSPGCPAGGMIMSGAQQAAAGVDGIDEAEVKLVWKPFWTPERIDPEVRAALGF